MALSAFLDLFSVGAGGAGSTVVRTGYGFTPKACIYWHSGTTSTSNALARGDIRGGIGVASSPTQAYCINVQSDDTPTIMNSDRRQSDARIFEIMSTTGANWGSASLTSFDSASGGGQTITLSTNFSANIRVHALALGGDDLTDALAFVFRAPTTTGNADVTTLGFQPDALLLFGMALDTAPPVTTFGARLHFGMATASGQGVLSLYDADVVPTSVNGGYQRRGECIASMNDATLVNIRASLVSFLSNGFRLNWTEMGVATQPYVFGLALKGGQYSVGSFTATNTLSQTIPVTSVGFQPSAGLFLSTGFSAESAADTPAATAAMTLGAMTSPSNRGCQTFGMENGATAAHCQTGIRDDAIILGSVPQTTPAVAGLVDISTVDSDGFTAIMDDPDPNTPFIQYLLIGPTGGAATPAPASATQAASATELASSVVADTASVQAVAGPIASSLAPGQTSVQALASALAAEVVSAASSTSASALPLASSLVPGQASVQAVAGPIASSLAPGQASVQAQAVAVPSIPATFVDGRLDFAATETVIVEGDTHDLGTAQLLIQTFDAGTPWATQIQGQVSVHPTSLDVQAQFVTPQAGYILIGAAARPAYGATFTAGASPQTVTVLASAHGYATPNLLVQVYDSSGTLVEAAVRVNQSTYAVEVTLALGMAGRVVIGSAVPPGPPYNLATPFSGVTSVTVPGSTHALGSADLLVQVYDAATPAIQVRAPITVDPGSFTVTATFPPPGLSGTLVLGGGSGVAAQGGSAAVQATALALVSQIVPGSAMLSALASLVASSQRAGSASVQALVSTLVSQIVPGTALWSALASLVASSQRSGSASVQALVAQIVSQIVLGAGSSTASATQLASSLAPGQAQTSALAALLMHAVRASTATLQALATEVASSLVQGSTLTQVQAQLLSGQLAVGLAQEAATALVTVPTNTRAATAQLQAAAVTLSSQLVSGAALTTASAARIASSLDAAAAQLSALGVAFVSGVSGAATLQASATILTAQLAAGSATLFASALLSVLSALYPDATGAVSAQSTRQAGALVLASAPVSALALDTLATHVASGTAQVTSAASQTMLTTVGGLAGLQATMQLQLVGDLRRYIDHYARMRRGR